MAFELSGAPAGFLAVGHRVAAQTEAVQQEVAEAHEVTGVAVVTGEWLGIEKGHVGRHVFPRRERAVKQKAEFAEDRGASDAIGQSADTGEVVLDFVCAGFASNLEQAFAGEVVEAVIKVGGTELFEEAGLERGEEKLVGEAQGKIDMELGLPFAGAGCEDGPVEIAAMVVEDGGKVSDGAKSVAGEAMPGQVGTLVEKEVFGAEDMGGDAGDGGGAKAGDYVEGVNRKRQLGIRDGPVDLDAGVGGLVVGGEVFGSWKCGLRIVDSGFSGAGAGGGCRIPNARCRRRRRLCGGDG